MFVVEIASNIAVSVNVLNTLHAGILSRRIARAASKYKDRIKWIVIIHTFPTYEDTR